MKILITGAGGFIGKNLISALHTHGFFEIQTFDADTPIEFLEKYCTDCEFVYHLAGVNRPKSQDEFMQGNFGFTDTLLRVKACRHYLPPNEAQKISAQTESRLRDIFEKSYI